MQHCRETVFFHHGCYMFAHQSSTPRLEIVNPPKGDGYCLTLGSQKHFRSVEKSHNLFSHQLKQNTPSGHKYPQISCNTSSTEFCQSGSANSKCWQTMQKYHPTSMFGNSPASTKSNISLYQLSSCFSKIVPWFSHIFPMKLAILGISSARNTLSLPASTRWCSIGGHGCGWAVGWPMDSSSGFFFDHPCWREMPY